MSQDLVDELFESMEKSEEEASSPEQYLLSGETEESNVQEEEDLPSDEKELVNIIFEIEKTLDVRNRQLVVYERIFLDGLSSNKLSYHLGRPKRSPIFTEKQYLRINLQCKLLRRTIFALIRRKERLESLLEEKQKIRRELEPNNEEVHEAA